MSKKSKTVIVAGAIVAIAVSLIILWTVTDIFDKTDKIIDYSLIPVKNADKWGYINHKGTVNK